ncbi:MAG TPA: haloacid dehalogenase-like hydrolase, partial [Bacillota bacterium]
MKRLLDCDASDFAVMGKQEILASIKASEGRVLVSEVIGTVQPLLYNVS